MLNLIVLLLIVDVMLVIVDVVLNVLILRTTQHHTHTTTRLIETLHGMTVRAQTSADKLDKVVRDNQP